MSDIKFDQTGRIIYSLYTFFMTIWGLRVLFSCLVLQLNFDTTIQPSSIFPCVPALLVLLDKSPKHSDGQWDRAFIIQA